MKKIRGEELDIIHKVVELGVNTWGNPTQLCSDLPTGYAAEKSQKWSAIVQKLCSRMFSGRGEIQRVKR